MTRTTLAVMARSMALAGWSVAARASLAWRARPWRSASRQASGAPLTEINADLHGTASPSEAPRSGRRDAGGDHGRRACCRGALVYGHAARGILEQWFVADCARVRAGEAVAAVRIGEALHDIASPAAGRLRVLAAVKEVVGPAASSPRSTLTSRMQIMARDITVNPLQTSWRTDEILLGGLQYAGGIALVMTAWVMVVAADHAWAAGSSSYQACSSSRLYGANQIRSRAVARKARLLIVGGLDARRALGSWVRRERRRDLCPGCARWRGHRDRHGTAADQITRRPRRSRRQRHNEMNAIIDDILSLRDAKAVTPSGHFSED